MAITFKKFRIPHVFIFLAALILFCSILSYVVPSGKFVRVNCSKCKATFRADKIIEEKFDVAADAWSDKKILDFINKKGIKLTIFQSIFPVMDYLAKINVENRYNDLDYQG